MHKYDILLKRGDIMFLKCVTKNNVTRLYFYESYYKDQKTRQRLVRSLGRLDELEKLYSDPVAHFKELAIEETLRQDADKNMSFTIDFGEILEVNEDNIKNVGYGILKILYSELELDKFCKTKIRNRSIKYDFELIFRLLVFSRVLYPASKRETYRHRGIYF